MTGAWITDGTYQLKMQFEFACMEQICYTHNRLRSYKIQNDIPINTLWHRDAYMRHILGSFSVPTLVCCLCNTKLLFEQRMAYFLLKPCQTPVKYESKRNNFPRWERWCNVKHHLSFLFCLQMALKADNYTPSVNYRLLTSTQGNMLALLV